MIRFPFDALPPSLADRLFQWRSQVLSGNMQSLVDVSAPTAQLNVPLRCLCGSC